MNKFRILSTVLLFFLLALLPLQTVLAASDVSALAPRSMTHQSGAARGRLASLAVRDQQGWDDDDPAKYVRFTTPGVRYSGYRTSQLHSGVIPEAYVWRQFCWCLVTPDGKRYNVFVMPFYWVERIYRWTTDKTAHIQDSDTAAMNIPHNIQSRSTINLPRWFSMGG